VLFTFPSRYWCTIGRSRVFSLGRWSSPLPTGCLGPHGTRDTNSGRMARFGYRALTVYGRPFQVLRLRPILRTPRARCIALQFAPTTPAAQRIHAVTDSRFGLFPVRSSLLRESRLLSVPPGTEIFHFPGLASPAYGFRRGCGSITRRGLPHSGISGSQPVSGSPELLAAYYALPRLRAPRHPPYALLRLTILSPAQMLYSSAVVKEPFGRPYRPSPYDGSRAHPLVPKSLACASRRDDTKAPRRTASSA
jgi:hypothetical protein